MTEISDLANQADGSVLMKMGETVVLATAVMGQDARKDVDYLPLSVELEERYYAGGQILGGRFNRREGAPAEHAVLAARAVDRTLRPLFDPRIRQDIQVVLTLLATDGADLETLAINAASIVVAISSIPWAGPVAAVRLGQKKGESGYLVVPTRAERRDLTLDLLACGHSGMLNMLEVGAHEVSEADMLAAVEHATHEHEALLAFQDEIIAAVGKPKRALALGDVPTPERALVEGKRADARAVDEVRPLSARAGGVSSVLHGTGTFYRGETHVLTVLTLGNLDDGQTIEAVGEHEYTKHFLHHYNFPPFSAGETGRMGSPNRRMIGHGALVEKAFLPVLPDTHSFPHTIRLVSECMASNGSTSMASVCASTLALMDGGVPITKPVAGISIGLVVDEKFIENGQYTLLTDIQGPEDSHGDMDFKVAGTRDGITAIQMDIKVQGITKPIVAEALERARIARIQILEVLEREIATPRAHASPRVAH